MVGKAVRPRLHRIESVVGSQHPSGLGELPRLEAIGGNRNMHGEAASAFDAGNGRWGYTGERRMWGTPVIELANLSIKPSPKSNCMAPSPVAKARHPFLIDNSQRRGHLSGACRKASPK